MNTIYFYTCIFLTLLFVVGLAVVFTLLWVRNRLQDHNSATYDAKGPKSIDVLESVNIGNIEQWLHIRGYDSDNPILLFLHGASFSQIGWFDAVQRPWENYFTVVQWDQRQTGKSYVPLKQISSTMTNERMIEDTEEVIAYLRKRFNQEKIFLIGKSYGTYLGMHMVKRHPDWLHAYVADSQMINFMDFAHEEYTHLFHYAKTENNRELVIKLEAMAPRPDPENRWASFIEHEGFIYRELDRIGKGITPLSYGTVERLFRSMAVNVLLSKHLTLSNLYNIFFGLKSIFDPKCGFSEEIMGIDIPGEIGSKFDVPIFVFTGAHDWHVPHAFQEQWFKSITAPYKEQVWFENSRHYPYLEEPGKYLMILVEKVLPLASRIKV